MEFSSLFISQKSFNFLFSGLILKSSIINVTFVKVEQKKLSALFKYFRKFFWFWQFVISGYSNSSCMCTCCSANGTLPTTISSIYTMYIIYICNKGMNSFIYLDVLSRHDWQMISIISPGLPLFRIDSVTNRQQEVWTWGIVGILILCVVGVSVLISLLGVPLDSLQWLNHQWEPILGWPPQYYQQTRCFFSDNFGSRLPSKVKWWKSIECYTSPCQVKSIIPKSILILLPWNTFW